MPEARRQREAARANALTQEKIAAEAMVAKIIADQANAFDKRYMPRLSNSELSKEGMQALGAFLSGLGKAANLWETDPDARMGIGKIANLPMSRSHQIEAAGRATKRADLEATGQLQLPLGGSNLGKDDETD